MANPWTVDVAHLQQYRQRYVYAAAAVIGAAIPNGEGVVNHWITFGRTANETDRAVYGLSREIILMSVMRPGDTWAAMVQHARVQYPEWAEIVWRAYPNEFGEPEFVDVNDTAPVEQLPTGPYFGDTPLPDEGVVIPAVMGEWTNRGRIDNPIQPALLTGAEQPPLQPPMMRYDIQPVEITPVPATRNQLERTYRDIMQTVYPPLTTPVVPAPAPRIPPRVRVEITREGEGSREYQFKVTIDGTLWAEGLPATVHVRQYLPTSARNGLRLRRKTGWSNASYYNDALNNGTVTLQQMADALKAYHLARITEGAQTSAVSQSEHEDDLALLRIQPAMLVVGGLAYKLVPTDARDMRNPLRGIRQRAIAAARGEARRITEVATRDARNVTTQAVEEAERMREEMRRERERAGMAAPPQWLAESGYFFRPDPDNRGAWIVTFPFDAHIDHWQMYVPNWQRTLYWDSLDVEGPMVRDMWVNIRIHAEGQYTMHDVWATAGAESPHISESWTCMDLQGLQGTIKTGGQFRSLVAGLERGMKVVNMNSLLNKNMNGWHPFIQAQVPDGIRVMLTKNADGDLPTELWPMNTHLQRMQDWPANEVTWNNSRTTAEEGAEVFRVAEA